MKIKHKNQACNSSRNEFKSFLRKGLMLLSMIPLTAMLIAQNIKVTGTVKDDTQDPLIGVTISVKGQTIGTVSDFNGSYTLNVPNENTTLVFSYIGYQTKEVVVGKQTEINVILEESAINLGDVVVVGYGSTKKENLTGAIVQVDSKVFENRPVTSVTSALQGVAAGVNITPPSGDPSENALLNIRGTTSVSGGEPLVLIDGVEADINLLNPHDIENVSVLKDAAASAIYGVRAAYGVILITTKGALGDDKNYFSVTYNGNVSWSKPTYMPEFVSNPIEHVNFVNDALINSGSGARYGTTYVNNLEAYIKDPINNPGFIITSGGRLESYEMVNWTDLLLKDTSSKQSHNVNISGGSKTTRYYVSYGYVNQEGIFKVNPDVYQRNTFRSRITHQAKDWLEFGLRTSFANTKNNAPHHYQGSQNLYQSIVYSQPLNHIVQWENDPRYPEYNSLEGVYFADQNPMALLKDGGRDVKRNSQFAITPTLKITPLKGWNINVDFSYIQSDHHYTKHRKELTMLDHTNMTRTKGVTNNSMFEVRRGSKNYYAFNAFTDYERTFALKHYVKVMLGFNQEYTKFNDETSTRYDLLGNNPSLSGGDGPQYVAEDGWDFALRGGFGRINYIYDNKYLLEMNARYDGTSRFPKDDRFTFLPSFSAGWRITQEPFMEFSRTIFDDIKLRGSYGKLGNQLMNDNKIWVGNRKYYPTIPFMNRESTKFYPINGLLGQTIMLPPDGIIPSSLTWEKSATLDFGVDFTLLKNRLTATFDWYERITSDMLIQQAYPEVLGTKSPQSNTGELSNKGWELSVTWRDRIGKDFSYSITANIADSKAKITKWDGPINTVDDYYKGKRIGEIWGFTTLGIAATDEEMNAHTSTHSQNQLGVGWKAGDIMYANLDGDPEINRGQNRPDDHGDLSVIGNTEPRYAYSFSLNADYKGIFFNAFFQGIGKRDFYPENDAFWPVATQYFNTQKFQYNNTWTTSDPDPNKYFAAARPQAKNNRQVQTKYLQDASYLRLKNLTVGYTIPKKYVKMAYLSNVKVYFSGENILTHRNTKSFLDPEQSGSRGDIIYPFQKSYSFGIDITF